MKTSDRVLEIAIRHQVRVLRDVDPMVITCSRRVRTTQSGEVKAHDDLAFSTGVSEYLSGELEMPIAILDTGAVLTFFFGRREDGKERRQLSIGKPYWFDMKRAEIKAVWAAL